MIDLEKRAKAWDEFMDEPRDLTIGDTFNAAYELGVRDGAASVDREEIEWEFKKVRKMVEDAIPAHHRTGPAGVVYAAMVAAMDAVLEMMEEGNELSSVDKKHP